MFARPVDPFFAYNSAFSAAERCHKELELLAQQNSHHPLSSQHELGHQQPSRLGTNQSLSAANINNKRRKHSLHFEPEFLSALDSSLQDPPPVLSRPRPCKKPRHSTATTATASNNGNHTAPNTTNSVINSFAQSKASPPTAVSETLYPTEQGASTTLPRLLTSFKTTEGPSVIDLSSGEELIAMNVGQSDHKRPRESLAESSSSSVESLREVYDVLEDGSLSAVLDHAPALPSPAKRSRIDSSTNDDGPLTPLDELEQGRERKRPNRRITARPRHMHAIINAADNNNDTYDYRDEAMMDTTGWMSDDEDCHTNDTRQKAARPEMALIRYEGPKTVTLADGVDALIRKRWNDHHDIPSLDNLQGNELVLYRPPPPRALLDNDDNDDEPSLTIEELDDDNNIYQAAHISVDNPDRLIHELEDKIMDMDLD